MSKKELSRRDFLKGAAAGTLSLATAGLLAGCQGKAEPTPEAKGIYTPGTYSATATGMAEVKVTMTFDANSITNVELDLSGETPDLGGAKGEDLKKAILDAQSADIDAIGGVTVTSEAVKTAAEACIAQAKGESVEVPVVEPEKTTWRTAPDPIPDSQIDRTVETEVAIIGCGYAGLTTYRALAEAGRDVTIIEAMPRDTWWTVGHDIGHINSKFLASRGVPKVDVVEFVNNWMLQTHNKANPALVMKFAQNCGDNIDWFFEPVDAAVLEKGRVTYFPDNEYTIHQLNNGLRYYAGTAQWWENQWNNVGTLNNNTPGELEIKDLCMANLEFVEANYPNAKEMFGTRGIQLITEGGKVTGLIAQDADGKYVKVLASKGVVLSGGGFAGNAEMCEDLLPQIKRIYTENENFMGMMGRDGSTIQMGVWAGGRLEGEISTMNFDSMGCPDNIPGPLWVNDKGQRFQNEAFAGTEINGFFGARGKRGKTISIYDSTYPTQILRGYCGHSAFDFSDQPTVDAKMAQFAAAREAGAEGADGFFCADTIEELAKMIGVDPAALTATVERYNDLCKDKVDLDFAKDPRFMNPVAEGPFYAHVTEPSLGFALVTTGGFVTTNDQQVLDKDYQPIEGLYASGNTCGMRFGPAYITPIPGVSIGMCLTLGRELGKHLASL